MSFYIFIFFRSVEKMKVSKSGSFEGDSAEDFLMHRSRATRHRGDKTARSGH